MTNYKKASARLTKHMEGKGFTKPEEYALARRIKEENARRGREVAGILLLTALLTAFHFLILPALM